MDLICYETTCQNHNGISGCRLQQVHISELGLCLENSRKNFCYVRKSITAIIAAIRQYHLSLDRFEHGGVAQDKAIHAIEDALGMPWKQGEELSKQNK